MDTVTVEGPRAPATKPLRIRRDTTRKRLPGEPFTVYRATVEEGGGIYSCSIDTAKGPRDLGISRRGGGGGGGGSIQ